MALVDPTTGASQATLGTTIKVNIPSSSGGSSSGYTGDPRLKASVDYFSQPSTPYVVPVTSSSQASQGTVTTVKPAASSQAAQGTTTTVKPAASPTGSSPTASAPASASDDALDSLVSRYAGGAAAAATAATTAVSQAAGAVDDLDKLVSKYASSATGAISSAAGAVAGNVSSTVNSLATNTLNLDAAKLKTGVSDPLAKAFASKLPQATGFITSTISDALKVIDFSKMASMAANALGTMGKEALGAVADRLGIDLPSTNAALAKAKGLVADVMSNRFVGAAVHAVSSAAAVVLPMTKFARNNSGIASYLTQATTALGIGPAQAISYFQPNLPTVADALGKALPGIPTSTRYTNITQISSVVQSLTGSNPFAGSGATNYAHNQNMFNATLGVAASQGLMPAVSNLATSSYAQTASGKQAASSLVSQLVGSVANPSVISSLTAMAGPQNIGNKKSILTTLISNPQLTAAAGGVVNNLMTELGVGAEDLYGKGKLGSNIVWNQPGVQQANPAVATQVLPSNVVKYANGQTITWNTPRSTP